MGGRKHEPQNFPSFTVDRDALVWDWDSSSSNYSELVQAGYDANDGSGWLIESANNLYYQDVEWQLSVDPVSCHSTSW